MTRVTRHVSICQREERERRTAGERRVKYDRSRACSRRARRGNRDEWWMGSTRDRQLELLCCSVLGSLQTRRIGSGLSGRRDASSVLDWHVAD